MIRLTGLWKKEGRDGSSYLEGPLGNGKVYIFPTKGRGDHTNPNSPDYVLYVAEKQVPEEPGKNVL